MITDNYLVKKRPHPSAFIGGIQRIYRFPSGDGLSAVNGAMLHDYDFAWEIAVLKGVAEDGESFEGLNYDTELTDDVLVFSNDDDANSFIEKAAEYFSNKENKR